MRVFVKLYDRSGRHVETRAVPCTDAQTVASLKDTIVAEWNPSEISADFQLFFAESGTKVCEDEAAGDALKDGDFLCMRSKTASDPECPLPTYGSSLLNKVKTAEEIELDGNSLEIDDLMKIGRGEYRVKISEDARRKVERSRVVVENEAKKDEPIYGVNTGFGKLQNTKVDKDKLSKLQECLIRSHSVGVGLPLSAEQTRRLMTLRINVLAKGFSGIGNETLDRLTAALNASCLPCIPEKGTVGASGDLAPLAHLALGLMGEGKMWSPETGWGNAKEVLKAHGLKEIELGAKEGLALINGTQLITGVGVEALWRAERIAKQADVVAALSFEAMLGVTDVFDPDIHKSRPHPGQILVAARLRALVNHPSDMRCRKNDPSAPKHEREKNQDAYSLRCIPQVHGVANDTINFVHGILRTEINSALDNPMVLSGERQRLISCGNFHGEYPAKAMDYLAIGIHELANISERRMEKLTNPDTNYGLPAFLIDQEEGVNSGFMIAQYTAAALVSENKVLTHPSSVDSIPTSAGQEDHVSMGGFAARKALTVVEHVEHVLAIELLAACQAIELRKSLENRKKTTSPLEKVCDLVKSAIIKNQGDSEWPWRNDKFMAPAVEVVTKLLREGQVWKEVEPDVTAYEQGSKM